MLKLNITKTALSFIESLPGKQFKQVAGSMFSLLQNPEPHDSAKLKGYPYRRVDIGEYRIIYEVIKGELRVLIVGKRNDDDVYKQLKRKK